MYFGVTFVYMKPLIEVNGLKNYLGGQWVHSDVNFTVKTGKIVGIIGGSGSGKTTILRSLLLLQKPTAGIVKMFDCDIWHADEVKLQQIRKKTGMLFQKSALFSGLTILENVMFPLKHLTNLNASFIKELAFLKLLQVGLKAQDVHKMPSELSGGMQKRVAAARAIALEPQLLFLDEPVAGLDPKSAQAFDELLLFLRDQLGLTIVMVSHDIASLERTTDSVIFLGDGKVLSHDSIESVRQNHHPMIKDYFAVE
jgi:phospholipid/cholesterol/gamma-HCH transport system ATP-binding protein